MELITNWEAFNTASLAFCQFQGMVGIITITGIVIFKHNLGEFLQLFKHRNDEAAENQ
jgi:hypothetical protein